MVRTVLHACVAGATLLALAACSGPRIKLEKCHKPQEYQLAEIGPLVRMPEGLEPLDPEKRLEVPYGPTNITPTPPGKPCLVEPPQYMDRSPN